MKWNEREIRSAMNRRLSFLDADDHRRMRIRQRIESEEEPVMKRKITTGMILAVGLVLMLTGIALAAGLNIFEYFKDEDVRYAEIAPQAELATQAPVTVENAAAGTAAAFISNAYYDGNSLLVAYTIQNGTRVERFIPTDAQLAEMTKMERAMPVAIESNTENSLDLQYNKAVQSGTPFGVVTYSIYPSDHTITENGDDLMPATETTNMDADGTAYTIREYETPLPDQECLKLGIQLWQTVSYRYFDGTNVYIMGEERRDAGTMTATVWHADAKVLQMRGSGTWRNVLITADARVSAVHAELTLTADADVFTALDEDQWYEVILQDADGNTLRAETNGAEDERTIAASFQGTGILPDSLTVYLLRRSEGDFDETAAIAAATPIFLFPTEE